MEHATIGLISKVLNKCTCVFLVEHIFLHGLVFKTDKRLRDPKSLAELRAWPCASKSVTSEGDDFVARRRRWGKLRLRSSERFRSWYGVRSAEIHLHRTRHRPQKCEVDENDAYLFPQESYFWNCIGHMISKKPARCPARVVQVTGLLIKNLVVGKLRLLPHCPEALALSFQLGMGSGTQVASP